MMNERHWVESIAGEFQTRLKGSCSQQHLVNVEPQRRLLYTHPIDAYQNKEPIPGKAAGYATDLLVYDEHADDRWTPRVVIEVKLGSVTTHDALTYSSKAETHKTIHPYLRYGILIAGYTGKSLPARLFRHGAHFDFMITLDNETPSASDWSTLIGIVKQEVESSRVIQEFLRTSQLSDKKHYIAVHRPMIFS